MNFFNKKDKIIITIDGCSSMGKTSLAKALANKLKYNYIDSGAMYRAVTLLAIQKNIFNINNYYKKDKIFELLSDIKSLNFNLNKNTGNKDIILNGENVEKEIRTMIVSEKVSLISSIPEIRKKLLHIQRKIGSIGGVVIDGRDIGSVVFPNAKLKIFLKASLRIRVYRRYKELIKVQQNISYKKVYKNIIKRDFLDINRINSPLIKPKDAVEIDNTNIKFETQLHNIYLLALNKIN